MDFTFTEKEEKFRGELRGWLEVNLPKGWLQGDRKLPEDNEHYSKFLRDWQRTLYEGGWAAISWPQQYGGRDATLMEEIIYHQEMVRVQSPPLVNYIGIHMVAPTLMQMGTDAQKEEFIEKILTGEQVWSQGYSEPGAGSDLTALQTTAVKKDGKWVINGQKVWTSFAHLADRCFLLTKTSQSEKKHEGITVFLLDMDQEGVETRPIVQMDGHQEFNEVYLTDAIATDEDIVGEEGKGWAVLIALMLHERSGIAAQVFTLEQQFEHVIEMAKTVRVNGCLLIDDPFVEDGLADLYARINGAKLNYYRNITHTLKNGRPGPESSLDKLLVSELTKELFDFAMTIQGHAGVLMNDDSVFSAEMQGQYLASFGATIGGGTSEVQRNTIGERILGLPKDLGR